jgi:pimeloyl-ACP methyl ester carboxylesterase
MRVTIPRSSPRSSPLISTRAARQSEYEFVVAEAKRRNDDRALAKVEELGPPPYASAREALELEHLCDRYGGVFHTRPNRFWTVVAGIFEGLVTPWELPRLFHANDVSLDAMHAELQTLDLTQSVPRLRVPVFFFLGRFDRHVDARIAADYLDTLDAPVKRAFWFEDSAHNIPFEEPERFVVTVVESIDPGKLDYDLVISKSSSKLGAARRLPRTRLDDAVDAKY